MCINLWEFPTAFPETESVEIIINYKLSHPSPLRIYPKTGVLIRYRFSLFLHVVDFCSALKLMLAL